MIGHAPAPMQSENRFDRFAASYRETLNQSVAASGESADYFAQLKARYVRATLGEGFSGKLLDFGCGVGLLSTCLATCLPNAELHGFDPSEISITTASSQVAAGRAVFTSRLEDLDTNYDGIVVANVMHHVPPHQRRMLTQELGNRLASGGHLMIFEHNPANPLTRWAVHQCPFDDDAVLLWPGEVRSYLESGGLRLISRRYMVFFPRWLKLFRGIETCLDWCPMGAQYLWVARKG